MTAAGCRSDGLGRPAGGGRRFGVLLPLALDLLCIVPFIGSAVLVDAIGPPRSGDGSWFAGTAAGAVLMVPFSWTQRWLWWEWQHRRGGRLSSASGPAIPERDLQGDRRPGAEPDSPQVG